MTGRISGVLFALLAAILAPLGAPPASADTAPSVIFLGDSVTAGFGYLGAQENAPNISGSVNTPFANSWYLGNNSLSDCNPVAPTPDDRCSNNNANGTPWKAGPWKAGSGSPTVAYSYQIAAKQDPQAAVPVENWAVTGSTPAQWDTGGAFNPQLQTIKNTSVVMTLGANPILGSFLRITGATDGACSSTEWLGWTGWWAYSTDKIVECANQQWAQNRQSQHLESIYKTLLQNNNKVMVLQYYRACPWSFGNWQPTPNLSSGPATGNPCPSQTQKVSNCSKCPVDGTTSQWAQAVAAQNAMNDNIAAAVGEVQQWAADNGLNASNLQLATPDQSAWADHQAWHKESWIFKNDTWIHPSAEGHQQLAKTVTTAMCSAFGQWCGQTPAWDSTPMLAAATVTQTLRGKVPERITNRSFADLPNMTKQGNAVGWDSLTPKVCRVFHGGVGTLKKDGSCRLVAEAVRSGNEKKYREKHQIQVR